MKRLAAVLLLCSPILSAQIINPGGGSGSGNVSGPGVSVANDVATYCDTTGASICDGGFSASAGVITATSENLGDGTHAGQIDFGAGTEFGLCSGTCASIASPPTISSKSVEYLLAAPGSGVKVLANSGGVMTPTLVPVTTTSAANSLVETGAGGTIAAALTPGITPLIYSTAQIGVSMITSGSGTANPITTICTSGVCTMASSLAADGTYLFTAQVSETTIGSGGTCTTGTVQMQLGYAAADTTAVYSAGSSVMAFASVSVPQTYVSQMSMAPGALTGTADYIAVSRQFRAKAGTAITYTLNQFVASNCTTPPVFAVRPALYGPMGY